MQTWCSEWCTPCGAAWSAPLPPQPPLARRRGPARRPPQARRGSGRRWRAGLQPSPSLPNTIASRWALIWGLGGVGAGGAASAAALPHPTCAEPASSFSFSFLSPAGPRPAAGAVRSHGPAAGGRRAAPAGRARHGGGWVAGARGQRRGGCWEGACGMHRSLAACTNLPPTPATAGGKATETAVQRELARCKDAYARADQGHQVQLLAAAELGAHCGTARCLAQAAGWLVGPFSPRLPPAHPCLSPTPALLQSRAGITSGRRAPCSSWPGCGSCNWSSRPAAAGARAHLGGSGARAGGLEEAKPHTHVLVGQPSCLWDHPQPPSDLCAAAHSTCVQGGLPGPAAGRHHPALPAPGAQGPGAAPGSGVQGGSLL